MKTIWKPTSEQSAVFELAQAPDPGPGIISQTLLDSPSLRVVRIAMGAGERLNEHSSTRPLWIQILAGTAEFTLEGRRHPLGPGDGLWMPAHTPHAVTAQSPLLLHLILAPPATPASTAISFRRPEGLPSVES